MVGLATLAAFVLSGQMMKHHHPDIHTLADAQRMLILSRHLYLLGGALVNLALGLQLKLAGGGWQKLLQLAGSILIAVAPVLLGLAFLVDMGRSPANRTWWAANAWFAMLGGMMLHLLALFRAPRIDTAARRL